MNPFVATWLAVDVAALALVWWLWRAERPERPHAALIPVMVFAFASGVASFPSDEPLRSTLAWATFVLSNAAFAIAGFRHGGAPLAVVGLIGTVIAVALLMVHAMISLPVVAVAGVVCVGSALLGALRQRQSPILHEQPR